MSNGEVRKLSMRDVDLVQNLIERCLVLYMTQKEVVSVLSLHACIEPQITETVWQTLETQNEDFFRAYYVRLIVKDQISQFNQLLETQIELINEIYYPGASIPLSNGSQLNSMDHNSAPLPVESSLEHENMRQVTEEAMFNVYTNNGSSSYMGGDHGEKIYLSQNIPLAANSNSNSGMMMQGLNGGSMINSVKGYITDSQYMVGEEPHHTDHFNGGLTPDSSISTAILENYYRSLFLATDASFMNPQIRQHQQDFGWFDPESEGGFGSDE